MSKKIKILLISIIYIGLIFIGTKVYAATVTMNEETVRLRKTASTKGEVVELLSKGEKAEVVEKDGEWYKVKYKKDGKTYTGYIRDDLVKEDEEEKVEEQPKEVVEKEKATEKEESENEISEETETKEESQESVVLNEGDSITLKNKVDVKILPLISSMSIGDIAANEQITVIEVIGKWYHIESNSQSGWVMSSKIQKADSKVVATTAEVEKKEPEKEETKKEETKKEETKTVVKYVNASTVNVREKTEINSKIVDQLSRNTKVTVLEVVDKTWSKVKFSGKTGYIASKYLSDNKTEEETTSRSKDEERSTAEIKKEETKKTESTTEKKTETVVATTEKKTETTAVTTEKTTETTKKEETTSKTEKVSNSKVTGADVVAYAKKFLGCKYVYGATGPNEFDCSGFTSYVYKHFGYSLSRTSSGQRSDGTSVKKADLQAGDIVCFSGHVGIYIGGGKFIHAANAKKGVIITALKGDERDGDYYTNHYITARRILK